MNDGKTHGELSFLDLVYTYRYYFIVYTLIVASVSFAALYLAGGVPTELRVIDEPPAVTNVANSTGSTTASVKVVDPIDLPERIIIDKIGIDTSVSNPTSKNTEVLNAALLKGAVRYPGSGTLGRGNMFLFGHSTGIRVVNNQAYKTFNHISTLSIGDKIVVRSATKDYTYVVTSVSLVNDSDELVDFSNKKDMLTLSTCNVFGEKQERFVVEALFEKTTARGR